ncbi:MAG: hypothetical protein QGI45_07415 [Myxococcota bacterium]|jgi:hypothetical protein|nr:hypothetical protein [Myxococcota bacterium]
MNIHGNASGAINRFVQINLSRTLAQAEVGTQKDNVALGKGHALRSKAHHLNGSMLKAIVQRDGRMRPRALLQNKMRQGGWLKASTMQESVLRSGRRNAYDSRLYTARDLRQSYISGHGVGRKSRRRRGGLFERIGRACDRFLQRGFKKVGQALRKGIKKVGWLAKQAGQGIKRAAQGVGNFVKRGAQFLGGTLKALGKSMWTSVKTIGKTALSMTKGIVKGCGRFLKTGLALGAKVTTGALKMGWCVLKASTQLGTQVALSGLRFAAEGMRFGAQALMQTSHGLSWLNAQSQSVPV